jgi:N-acetylglutamate synthase-like GNAT family acetyltransferase
VSLKETKIVETKDFEIFNTFVKKFDLEDTGLDYYYKAWVAISNGKKVGGISLKKKGKTYLLDIIAVDKKFQKKGLGKKLLLILLRYLKKEKVPRLYVDTKIPEFFSKFGFKKVSKPTKISSCWNCSRYGKTCCPTHMVLELKT